MHNTGNDLESNDILDFEDNTVNLDIVMNTDDEFWTDRFGNKRPTIDYALKMAGFTPAGFDFVSGGVLNNGDRNKCVFNQVDQTWYSWTGELPYNVIAGSAPGEGWKVVNYFSNLGWEDITKPPYNVKFDNVTDNAEGLNKAFMSGKRIVIPKPLNGKVAMTSKPIKWRSGTQIRGPGKDIPVIKAFPSMPGELDLICNENYLSENLIYDERLLAFDLCVHANGFARSKNLPIEWGRGIRLAAVRDSLLIRCRVIEGPQHCIDITNFNDSYIGIGQRGVVNGPSYNIVISECEVEDYCYDDGITTHGSFSILIENSVGRITDNAKTKHSYVTTQNAFEIDDGSWDVVVSSCRAYGNRTKSKGFSVATHSNAPAAYNIIFRDCIAYNTIIGFNAWADVSTDVAFGSIDWKCRNIIVENFSLREPFVDLTSQVYPSRCVDITGFMDVQINSLKVFMASKENVVDTPISMVNFNSAKNVKLNNFMVVGVQNDSLGSVAYRDRPWINIVGASSDIYIDGVDIDNIGYCNRIITDSEVGALREVKNLTVRSKPADGETKVAITSGSLNVVYKNINTPSNMVPYKIGRSFNTYPAGDYVFNQDGTDTIVGGYTMRSETLADGTQVKPAFIFDRQFISAADPTGIKGKGTLAFRTSAAAPGSFSISAFHEELNEFRPVILIRSSESPYKTFSPAIDNDTTNGDPSYRWKGGYFATSPVTTSDASLKSLPKEISDQILDVVDDIEIILYQWLDMIEEKGGDNARWHFGVIAQQVRDAFIKHDLDGRTFGLLCYDEWEDTYEDIMTQETSTALVINDKGEAVETLITKEYPTGERILIREAGSSWGIRPDQCHWLLLAAQRRKNKILENEISLIKKHLGLI